MSILFLLFWIGLAVSIIQEELPTEKKLKKRFLTEIFENYEPKYKELPSLEKQKFKQKYLDEIIEEKKLTQRVLSDYRNEKGFLEREEKYLNELKNLPKAKYRYIGAAIGTYFLSWLLPVVIVYLFGVSVAWVIKGFKQEKV